MRRIDEDANSWVVDTCRALADRSVRDRRSLYLADGARYLYEASALGETPIGIAYVPEILCRRKAIRLIDGFRQAGVPCCRAHPADYYRCAEVKEPSGVLLVLPQKWLPLRELLGGGIWIAAEAVASAGNIGCIIRSAASVGANGMIFLDSESDPYAPGNVRASMAAVMAMPFTRSSPAELRRWARVQSINLIGASPRAQLDFTEASYAPASAIVVGSEKKGLAPTTMAICDQLVRIPMIGRNDSVNVSVAAGVLLFEAKRRQEEYAFKNQADR